MTVPSIRKGAGEMSNEKMIGGPLDGETADISKAAQFALCPIADGTPDRYAVYKRTAEGFVFDPSGDYPYRSTTEAIDQVIDADLARYVRGSS